MCWFNNRIICNVQIWFTIFMFQILNEKIKICTKQATNILPQILPFAFTYLLLPLHNK